MTPEQAELRILVSNLGRRLSEIQDYLGLGAVHSRRSFEKGRKPTHGKASPIEAEERPGKSATMPTSNLDTST